VTSELTDFQKRLCNRLQKGLPLCTQPFAEMADDLDRTEAEVLEQTRDLATAGIIRRLSVQVNCRALGMSSTLVTAHVPPEQLTEVTTAVNRLPGVSHNYLRNHHFNLWFTLQGKTAEQIRVTLLDLQTRFSVDFHSLPVTHVFKLDVRFDVEDADAVLLQDVERVPGTEPVEITDEQRQILAGLQGGLEVTSRPFDAPRPAGIDEERYFALLGELIDLGVIRRIGAVLNHHKLGFGANVMFAAQVPPERVVEAGRRLARFGTVSHCYERETFEGWPYNLFAMMHGRSMAQIQRTIDKFTAPGDVQAFELLPTQAELKKQPVRHTQL
jgi:DNA-binding Lrp family transcriptional regulator